VKVCLKLLESLTVTLIFPQIQLLSYQTIHTPQATTCTPCLFLSKL